MENSDIQVSATPVVPQSPDEVKHDAQSAGVSNKPTDAAYLQTREEAGNQEDSGALKVDTAQADIVVEAQSESRDTQSAEAKAAGSNSTPPTQSYVPPVKRFSAVNINKKFLQKNQSSGAAGSTASPGSSNKQTGVIARPAPQTAHSHSRLVTAKLTASPLSSSPGQGWTRPNSVTPPAPSPANVSGPAKGSIPNIVPVGGHGPPHLAPGGKIIQPQALKQKVDGPGRQAWRSVQPGVVSSGLQTQNEFPTAAEAARSQNVRPGDLKATAELGEVQKQLLSETADAFRGVHLDPNAHHWDEMEEEDNDDFLGDIIEFGDGRQYTIHASEGTTNDAAAPGVLDPNVPVGKTERFVDDFDRSWPKSREDQGIHKEEFLHQGRAGHSDPSSSFPSPSSARDGPQSRLLFNERSNRMEPIQESRHGFASHVPSYGVQIHRNGQDRPGRFHSNRVEHDVPPHSAFAGDRKPQESSIMSHGFDQRAREIRELKSESSALYFHGDHDRMGRSGWSSSTHGRPTSLTRPLGSRETSVSRSVANGAPSIASSDDQSGRQGSLNRDHHLAPLPHSGHVRDIDRQLPHSPMDAPPAFPSGGSSVSAESHKIGQWVSPGTLSEVVRTSDLDRPQPALSVQTHLDTVVPVAASSIPPNDVEALRKAYLAESAERAKKRRQQEEEERLKAQERARKKAAELEAKMVAAKTAESSKGVNEPGENSATGESYAVPATEAHNKPTEAEVLQVIEDAIGSADPSDAVTKDNPNANDLREKEATSPTPSFAKPPRRDRDQYPVHREAHGSTQPRRPPPTAFADQADSWRTKSKPPVLPVDNSNNDISREPGVSVLPDIHAFELHPDESVEVVDFADMSRLVGEKAPHNPVSEVSLMPSKPARPVASDFFKGTPPHMVEQGSWRKPSAHSQRSYSATTDNESVGPSHQVLLANLPEANFPTSVNDRIAESEANSQDHPKAPSSPTSASAAHSYHPHTSPGAPRFLRSPNASYREAPLSALDDTMSRIKGALDVMHSGSDHGGRTDNKDTDGSPNVHLPASSPSNSAKWLPPALRPPGTEVNRIRSEIFESTHPEPPRSPAPTDASLTVRLPRVSRRIGPLTKKQIAQQKFFGPVRWEILSFDPPVEGMTKKSLSVNDVLFRKPQSPYKSRKYRVLLPKSTASSRLPAGNEYQRIVSDKSASRLLKDGALGHPKGEHTSWRFASASARLESTDVSENDASSTLHVTSRSPPPELAPTGKTGFSPVVSGATSKLKSSYKMLDVADVAFYRDGRKHTEGNPSVPTVTFTVGSELEDQAETSFSHNITASSTETAKPQDVPMLESTIADIKLGSQPCPDPVPTQNAPVNSERQSATTGQSLNQAGMGDKTFERKSDPFLQGRPVTPASQKSPSVWGKSPSRAPDPEHLKAVWSQAPDSDSVPTVNSLRSIADDLPAVPFTLQEVKSECGTPPPAAPGPVAPPTRMSASEVTRAFQTVPSGPSNGIPSNGLRTNHSSAVSPMSSQRALKPPPIGLPPVPAMNPSVPRPPYLGYPTSLNNHSPSPPTLVYSHVMSNGLASSPAASPYGQPMWMPVVQQGSQMLRPQPASPYSPSLMPYPMPPAQNGMYPPAGNAPNPQGSPATYPSAPPPSQMMVSPILSHASPAPPHLMYQGSPMVVHVQPAGGAPQSRSYPAGVVGMGRGTMPVQNPMDPRSHPPPGPPAAPASRFPVQNPGYTHVAPPSYVRPW